MFVNQFVTGLKISVRSIIKLDQCEIKIDKVSNGSETMSMDNNININAIILLSITTIK